MLSFVLPELKVRKLETYLETTHKLIFCCGLLSPSRKQHFFILFVNNTFQMFSILQFKEHFYMYYLM